MAGYQAPRGMRDLLPEEAAGFDALAAVVLARAARYGYPRIETPTLEERGVFVKTSGESSDIVGKEMYEVSQQGEGGLVLRPEGTPGVARSLLEHGLHKSPRPIRFAYFEPMFRGQRPQKLRFRQFWQWGLECFGAEEPAADVEIIEFANGFFRELGLGGYEIQINTIGDGKCRQKVKEALTAYFAKHKDALSPASQRRIDTNVLRVLDSKEKQDRPVIEAAPKILDLLCEEDQTHFSEVQEGLTTLGIPFKVTPTLVRGLDYYTRTVTEFVLTAPEYQGIAVAGGGRYDGLVKIMGGEDLAGTGIAGGVDVLYYALREEGSKVAEDPKPDVYVISARPDDVATRMQLAAPLRDAGFTVAIDYSKRALDKQLEGAVKHGAKVAIIAGTPEARGGHVVVRDLAKKEQRVTRLAAVVTEVKRRVAPRAIPTLWRPPTDPGDKEPGAAGEVPHLEDPRN
ncbi:MAG: histidine--tRNA ligase [Candidatus Limnocylindria bacterium]|nr:histidine--tRNA ligase [Candidatus Limnocylindria bacterium]